jgi:rare lipoprotein A
MPCYARVTNLRNGRSLVVRVNDRGPYVGNRLIDVSTKAAHLLGFHAHGVTRVRVEYVGAAPLEGSDDRLLAATLREGAPAPAPSAVMMASARPFVPPFDDRRAPEAAAERPYRSSAPVSSNRGYDPPERDTVMGGFADRGVRAEPLGPPPLTPGAPPFRAAPGFRTGAGEAPARDEIASFISGRGLY